MMWLFKSPERAKLTGGLFSLVLCSKNVEIIFPLRAVGQNSLGAAVGSFQPEDVDRWLFKVFKTITCKLKSGGKITSFGGPI